MLPPSLFILVFFFLYISFEFPLLIIFSTYIYIYRIEDLLTDITTRSVLSMLKIFAVISLVVHFMACLWVLIGRTEDIQGKENWLNNDLFNTDGQGFTYKDTEGGSKASSIYIAAYFFCYTTITSKKTLHFLLFVCNFCVCVCFFLSHVNSFFSS